MSDQSEDKKLTKEDHVINYAKALDELEKAIQPYREHKQAVKQHYSDNKWLSKGEMSLVLRAYRMLKKDESVDDISEIFNILKGKM